MNKLLFVLISLFFSALLQAQEINASVSVNSSKIQGNNDLFRNLEEHLRIFINDRKWTETAFQSNERIDCSITLVINEMISQNSFNAEILVQAQRPVYGSTYKTVLLNFRDTDFSFEYYGYQSLEFSLNNASDNLPATVAFYIYLILGLDFDSMSSLGGTPYFQNMRTLINNMQSANSKGWEPFGNNRNRYAIMQAFSESSFVPFRQMWYLYHRLGLDNLAELPDEARKELIASVQALDDLYARQPTSVLITLFGQAKLNELVLACAKATPDERKTVSDILRKIYPTRTLEIDKLK